MNSTIRYWATAAGLLLALAGQTWGELPNPVLQTVFPAGGKAGTSVTVTVGGAALDGLRDVRSSIPHLGVKKLDQSRFALAIPEQTPPGVYDLRVVGNYGMSSPRAFFVCNRTEQLETEPNDLPESAQPVVLDSVVNGRIDRPGDVDCFRFVAKAGQRVVLECWAERIDSQLRAVLEVYDDKARRLAVNRGHTGIDPLIEFVVPADGAYVVKLFDLTYLGGATHFYRLDIDTKPRVEFALPCVVSRGQSTRVRLFGRNLAQASGAKAAIGMGLDCVECDVKPPVGNAFEPLPLALRSTQLGCDGFALQYPGGHAPVLMAVSDVPVIVAAADHHVPDRAQEVSVPCEISGQLLAGDERHWYGLRAHKGEVFWIESYGERIGAPVDLDITVLEAPSLRELAKLTDHLENLGGARFPTNHLDPAGRWVAPADGHYYLLLRNVIGSLGPDPRRIYRLSIRREEPDFDLAVVSRRTDQPAGLNIWRGGREMAEVLAIRRRGLAGAIRVTAENLPVGVECPDVWIGPGQVRAPLVVTAGRTAAPFAGALQLVGHADVGGIEVVRRARGGSMIWAGRALAAGRLTQEVPLATGPEADILVTANATAGHVYQESVLDVAVDIERRAGTPATAVTLTGMGLPREVGNPIATIPAGKTKGWISFALPSSLPPGPYTIAVKAEASAAESRSGKGGQASFTAVSNALVVQLRPARIVLELNPGMPLKIRRGKTMQIRFTAERKHGFIGKIHTELVAPGGVPGLLCRGLTFVGGADSGDLQVIATEDAPLGRRPFLRLEAVGTLEDQPIFRGSRLVDLEVTE